jgi:hypothetical protein
MILQGDTHYHGEFVGIEDIGLFKAIVIADSETGQHRYINISRENSIEEVIFENEEEKLRFIELCTPNSIDISK